ncbi:uncharacterized protein VTP21DRAFT_3567 [Calcarisporiella thermophila]|uniref:uncharacterized protein n=1 Tax=Calcarisporiella thermophila TaxID=911321 RepID=UPI0037444EA8
MDSIWALKGGRSSILWSKYAFNISRNSNGIDVPSVIQWCMVQKSRYRLMPLICATVNLADELIASVTKFVEHNRDIAPDTLCHYWLKPLWDINLQMQNHLTSIS